MKIKAIFFVPGKPYSVKEYDSSEALFDEHHEKRWGLTKKECGWDLNREGYFIAPLTDKRKKYPHGSYLVVPKADYHGEQISKDDLILHIKANLDAYDAMHMFEEISGYITAMDRTEKLDDLGI
jgi:hypothetical protein